MVADSKDPSNTVGRSTDGGRARVDFSETVEGTALSWGWRTLRHRWRLIGTVGVLLVLIGAALPWYAYGTDFDGLLTERSLSGLGNMLVGLLGGLAGALLLLDRTAEAGRPPLRGTFLLGLLLSATTVAHLVQPWWFSGGPNRDGFGVLHVEPGLYLAALGSLLIALAPATAAVAIATDAE